jgi:hypothetical protein
MSDIPIRSITLKGNFEQNGTLTFQLVHQETITGLWRISVKDIAISFKSDVNVIAEIQCNLVKDLKFDNTTSRVINYSPNIAMFVFKGKIGEKKNYQAERCWFEINAPNDELKITFVDAETNNRLDFNSLIFITILLQRIK